MKVKSEVYVSTSTSLTTHKREWCPHRGDSVENNEEERFREISKNEKEPPNKCNSISVTEVRFCRKITLHMIKNCNSSNMFWENRLCKIARWTFSAG